MWAPFITEGHNCKNIVLDHFWILQMNQIFARAQAPKSQKDLQFVNWLKFVNVEKGVCLDFMNKQVEPLIP